MPNYRVINTRKALPSALTYDVIVYVYPEGWSGASGANGKFIGSNGLKNAVAATSFVYNMKIFVIGEATYTITSPLRVSGNISIEGDAGTVISSTTSDMFDLIACSSFELSNLTLNCTNKTIVDAKDKNNNLGYGTTINIHDCKGTLTSAKLIEGSSSTAMGSLRCTNNIFNVSGNSTFI